MPPYLFERSLISHAASSCCVMCFSVVWTQLINFKYKAIYDSKFCGLAKKHTSRENTKWNICEKVAIKYSKL